MQFVESMRLALSAIKANRMRSFLTMLGIIIGISSVITISAIGASAKGAINAQFEGVGAGYMYIMPNWQMTGDYLTENDLITKDEADALKARFGDKLQYYAPYAISSGTTVVGRNNADLTLYGIGPDYMNYQKSFSLSHGRMVTEADLKAQRPVMIIEDKAALYLFGKEDVTGQTMSVSANDNMYEFTIIGVYTIPPSIFAEMDTSKRYTCYVPYSLNAGLDYMTYDLECFVNSEGDVDALSRSITNYLSAISGMPEGYYTYETAAGQMDMINNVLNILSLAIGAIAAISLLVGGIGIMNIMLVSVTERTREIGIRKSLGARTKDILSQFLIEAMILSAIGGIIGLVFGLSLAGIAAAIVGVDLIISPITVVAAIVFSAAVGMFFGLFPARKAAKLDPIEALRYE